MLSVSDSDAEDPGSPPGGGKIVIVCISYLYSIVYIMCVKADLVVPSAIAPCSWSSTVPASI